jgi:general secretion pathway protein E
VGELLVLNDELREAIVARAPARKLKELAKAGGATLLRVSALELVYLGKTTLLEANRVTALA